MIHYLDVEAVTHLHAVLMEASTGMLLIRDRNGLESAVAQPMMTRRLLGSP